jgi:hypothetical protein
LYDHAYGNDIPVDQYFLILFDRLPSKYSTKALYFKEILNYFVSLGFYEECKIIIGRRNVEQLSRSLFVHDSKKIMIECELSLYKNSDLLSLSFIYDIKSGDIYNQLDFQQIHNFKKLNKKSNIELVRSDMGQLDTEEFDLHIPEYNMELNYGKDFIPINELILNRLNTPFGKGIIILYGDPGTGKTTYIKSLTKQIPEKKVLFIPPSMAMILSEPSIIPFLMDFRDSILIIEDGQDVIGDRRGKASSAAVSNILNITDGILGDCLGIQIIATCNIPREKIDPALLRKGRLICEHQFNKLNLEDTNILLKYIGKNIVSDKPLTLADIYNIDTEIYKSEGPRPFKGYLS